MKSWYSAGACFIAFLFTAFRTSGEITIAKRYTFIYECHDEFEEYTIKVTSAKIYLSIGTYNKNLAKDTFAYSRERYDSFATALAALHIVNRANVSNRCIGGGSHWLQLYVGTLKEVKGYYVSCGDEKFGDLDGDVPAAAELFNSLIPDLYERVDAAFED